MRGKKGTIIAKEVNFQVNKLHIRRTKSTPCTAASLGGVFCKTKECLEHFRLVVARLRRSDVLLMHFFCHQTILSVEKNAGDINEAHHMTFFREWHSSSLQGLRCNM